VPGLLATAATDKTVKLWDAHAASPGSTGSGGGGGLSCQPVLVAARDMAVGKLFGLGWCFDPAHPWGLACAGSKATLALWFCDESANVPSTFGARVVPAAAAAAAAAASASAAAVAASAARAAKDGAAAGAAAASQGSGVSGESGGEGFNTGFNAKKKKDKKTTKKSAGAK